MKRRRGELWAVGVGIRAPSQATFEASARIERAERVFSILADPLAEYWVRGLNANTESLGALYAAGKDRRTTYSEMVERIVGAVRGGFRVCAVAYGHPGVSAYPLHESVRRARAEGFPAQMLPGVSAEDCLFADLGIDPTDYGCRSYEATEFLIYGRDADPTSYLILWQIGAIAVSDYVPELDAWNRDGLTALTERLLESYPAQHEVAVYDAATLPLCSPLIKNVALAELPRAPVTAMSTLFVPPKEAPRLDEAMLRRLRLAPATPTEAG
ncbi:MAG TPA: SAM-dependent methyltransferase [Candidatus Nitrosotalea sp.]|nr:SAM-dependent methyltransferase [Candidatus Nitrosotalea sp.]